MLFRSKGRGSSIDGDDSLSVPSSSLQDCEKKSSSITKKLAPSMTIPENLFVHKTKKRSSHSSDDQRRRAAINEDKNDNDGVDDPSFRSLPYRAIVPKRDFDKRKTKYSSYSLSHFPPLEGWDEHLNQNVVSMTSFVTDENSVLPDNTDMQTGGGNVRRANQNKEHQKKIEPSGSTEFVTASTAVSSAGDDSYQKRDENFIVDGDGFIIT